MLSQRTVVPPGFSELAADAELAAQLGTPLFGALVRLCHLAEPAVDVPGGWCTTLSAEYLSAALGVTRKTAAKWCADLVAAGLLVRVEGRRLGRGLGATPTRYFITAIAGLTIPPPSGNTRGSDSPGKSSRGNDARVMAFPAQGSRASRLVGYSASESPHPVVVDSLERTSHAVPDPALPTWLKDALRQIGFVGQIPPSVLGDIPADKILRVIDAVRTRPGIESRPRYLNWLLRSGLDSIDTFLADVPGVEPTAVDPMMSSAEYVVRGEKNPEWKAAVLDRAHAEAAERGTPVDLRAVLRAAAHLSDETPITEAR